MLVASGGGCGGFVCRLNTYEAPFNWPGEKEFVPGCGDAQEINGGMR